MVLNRIERKERDNEERRKYEELQRQRAERLRWQEENEEQIEDQRLEEERRQLVRRNTDYVLGASGVLQSLEDTERGRLSGTVKKHALVTDLDTGSTELVWGSKFSVEDNHVGGAHGWFGSEEADYQSIKVTVNPDTLDLSICGATCSNLTKKDWENNPDRVEDALADAYLKPNRVTSREKPSSSSHSSYSSGIEC